MKAQTKKILLTIAASYVVNGLALIVLMMKVFYPYHRMMALILYAISWGIFVFAIKHLIVGAYKKHKSIALTYAPTCAIFLGLIVTLWVILSLFPINNFSLAQSDKIQLTQKMDSDQIYVENYTRKLHETETSLIHEIQNNPLATITPTEKNKIRELWRDYLSYFTALDEIVNEYKYFYQINVVTDTQLHQRAFVLAYASFVSPYASSLLLIDEINKVPLYKTILNEKNIDSEIPQDSYLKIEQKLLKPENALQAAAGYTYLQTIQNKNLEPIKKEANENYKSILAQTGKNPQIGLENALDYFEKNTFTVWFPLQKRVAEQIGDTKIPLREEALIDKAKIQQLIPKLQPGDVILERRNWYLSNAGLPGFWKHTAIYVGSLTDLDHTFAPSQATDGLPLSEFLQKKYPQLYNEFKDNKKRTIEAESEGVISYTVEKSISADYIAVLRPKISSEEKLKALLTVFAQFGKPYDFDFDFLTDNSIVCSELYYKAYPMMKDQLRLVSGRLVLSSNHIAEDYDQKYETQKNLFQFIIFIDANEKLRTSFLSGETSFRSSWKRTESDVVKTLVTK